ncbi:hypothetical protein CXB51_031695 [Gossypium anomalum]|uniref:RNase H type-1 domain-containing protein n=1 Tax=Gossypium anomalum TaxID=47600 RepID=A0A8J6CH83_9ROSI|nr:hypothetical protein CXB51_031695 [Gossypium anomalum]
MGYLFMNKYNVHGLLSDSIKWDNCLHLWRSLSNKWDEIKDGVIWSIRYGCLVNFWNDHWVEGVGPLKLYQRGGDQIDETLRVYNVATINGSWNWNWLETILPQTILDHIATIMPPSHDSGTGRLTWRWMLKAQSSFVAVEGVFRDHEGEWLLRFDMNIGRSSVYQTEARALYEGMIMAWNEGFHKITVKSNNAILTDSINNGYALDNNLLAVQLIHTSL